MSQTQHKGTAAVLKRLNPETNEWESVTEITQPSIEGLKSYHDYASPQLNYYQIERRQYEGRPHLVVPVIMMVEGVHNGSNGRVLHLEEELNRHTGSWNGRPVVVHHPDSGSANLPEVLPEVRVGQLFNTGFDNGKLKSEAWLDEARLREVSPETLQIIEEARPLDVSVGVFADDEPTSGKWHEETYEAISRNHRPDHLALLPGAQGACSWADGCGVRTNQKGGKLVNEKEAHKATLERLPVPESFATNEAGYRTLVNTIQQKLDAMDTDRRLHYLEEVYDEYFVYRVSAEGEAEAMYYKRDYTVAENSGLVEFGTEPTPVQKKVEFVELQRNDERNQTLRRTKTNGKKEEKGMADKVKKNEGCCPEKIALLVETERFTEDEVKDLSEATVDKLLAMEKELDEKPAAPGTPVTPAAPSVNEAVETIKNEFSKPDQFMSLMPAEVREQFNYGMRLHEDHRQKLISSISETTQVYTEQELKEMKTDALEKLSQAIPTKSDYSVLAGGSHVQQNTEEVLLPPGVKAQ